MAAPYSNLRSKLNRAIVAYLVSLANPIVGDATSISPQNAGTKNVYPITTVRATVANPDPPLTGNYRIPVHISVKGSAVILDANATAPITAFGQRVAATYDAMMQSDDGQTLNKTAALITAAGRDLATSDPVNNADMVDFTCEAVFDQGFGDGEPDDKGCAWNEILIFDCLCCSANTD